MVKIKTNNLSIFLTFLKIGVLGYGGGNATIPLFHKEAVDKHQWMNEDEFSDMLAVMNTLPGPVQTKMAGYIGYKAKGALGLLSGLAGIILPSLILMIAFLSFIAEQSDEPWVKGLTSGVLPVVGVLMAILTWQFVRKSYSTLKLNLSALLFGLSFLMLYLLDLHPITIIIPLLLTALFLPKNPKEEFKKTMVVLSIIIGTSLLVISLIYSQSLFGLSLNLPKVTIMPKNESALMNYFNIFVAFFIPGIIGYGGGPAMISLFKVEIVNRFGWTIEQFGEVVALGNALPGVTATKIAGYTGYQEGGILGIILGLLGMVGPSLIIMILLLNLLKKYKDFPQVKRLSNYVRPTLAVLLGILAYDFFFEAYTNIGLFQTILLAVISLTLLEKLKVHPAFVIAGSLIYGAFILGIFEIHF